MDQIYQHVRRIFELVVRLYAVEDLIVDHDVVSRPCGAEKSSMCLNEDIPGILRQCDASINVSSVLWITRVLVGYIEISGSWVESCMMPLATNNDADSGFVRFGISRGVYFATSLFDLRKLFVETCHILPFA